MNDSRWTLNELLARYELEPELRDVFVEGSFDREVLSQHRFGGCAGRTFYEIDAVDISVGILESYGLTLGNKQRVIALSKQLSQVSPLAQVVCLVDRDLDHWFHTVDAVDAVDAVVRLRWSVFCSIECHFLTKDTVRDIVQITSRSKIPNFELFFKSFEDVLRRLYVLRLADRELQLNLRWVALRKYLSNKDGVICFDFEKYVQAVLSSNAVLARKRDFFESLGKWGEVFNCDVRSACRGHDYTELLAWSISEFGGQKEFSTPAAIERIFVLLGRSIESLGQELQ